MLSPLVQDIRFPIFLIHNFSFVVILLILAKRTFGVLLESFYGFVGFVESSGRGTSWPIDLFLPVEEACSFQRGVWGSEVLDDTGGDRSENQKSYGSSAVCDDSERAADTLDGLAMRRPAAGLLRLTLNRC